MGDAGPQALRMGHGHDAFQAVSVVDVKDLYDL